MALTSEQRVAADGRARDLAWLVGLVGLFLASRLAWIVWSPETASYWEEAYRWVAASELLRAPVQPLLDYQADHYQGGSLLMILLTLPAFALAGESLFTFKLSALGISTATLGMLWWLNRRFFGRPVAIVACAAYVAGPTVVAYWGLVVMGSHGESVLWSLLQIHLFLGLLTGAWRSTRGWLGFGLASGLGIWFCYTAALSLLACALTWLLLERLPRRNEVGAAAAGLGVGLLPWWIYNLGHGFRGIDRVLEVIGLRPHVDPWVHQGFFEKLGDLVLHALPVALLDPFGDPATREPLKLLLGLASAVPMSLALVAALRRAARALASRGVATPSPEQERCRRELVFVVYLAVFVAVYLESRYAVRDPGTLGYRIFTPFAVLALTPAALSFSQALARPGRLRWLAGAGCAAWLGSIATATWLFASGEPPGGLRVDRETGYRSYGVLVHRKHEPDIDATLDVVRRLPAADARRWALFGVGFSLLDLFENRDSLEEVEAVLLAIPPTERAEVAASLAWTSGVRIAELTVRDARLDPSAAPTRERLRRLQTLASRIAAASGAGASPTPAAPH